MLCGLVPLVIVGAIREGNPLKHNWTLNALVSILYLALVGSVVAFMIYYWLVRNMDVTNTQLISLITPVIAVLIGVVFLNEVLTWRVFAGGLAIFAGIGIIILRRRKSARELPEPITG
jgi:drug/metabolite transporter (DMT)-like permease